MVMDEPVRSCPEDLSEPHEEDVDHRRNEAGDPSHEHVEAVQPAMK
jgi:hypothetical protein